MSLKTYSANQLRNKLSPLFKEEGLRLVLLFGSHGSDREHAQSDIDLGFLYDELVDLLDLTNRVTQLLHTDRVDVIDLRRANPLLGFSAARQREVIYERSPGQFLDFYSLSFRRYIDTKKLRDLRKRAIQRFIDEKEGA